MTTSGLERVGACGSSERTVLTVPMQRELVARIDAIAREQHRSRSAEVRRVLTLYADGALVAAG